MQTRLEADNITIAATTCGTRSLSNGGANRTNTSKLSKETVAQLVDALVPAFAIQIGSQQSMRHLSTMADAPNDIQVMWIESTGACDEAFMLYTSKDRKPSSRSSLLYSFVVHSLMYLFDPSLASYQRKHHRSVPPLPLRSHPLAKLSFRVRA
jgi:hypothetical protein